MSKFMTMKELEDEFGEFNLNEPNSTSYVQYRSIDLPEHNAVLGLLQVAQFRYDTKGNIDGIHIYPFVQMIDDGKFNIQSTIYNTQLTDRQKWILDKEWKEFIREYKGAVPGYNQYAVFIEKNKNFSIKKLKNFLYLIIADIKFFETQYELKQFRKYISD